MENLYKQLEAYGKTDYYPYHMPGHKRRLCGDMPEEIMNIDITEIEGFDNLHQSEGILLKLQEKAAQLYGAEESFYLINGSTGGILSAISAALPQGGHLLMARNSHKSAYHVAYLRNLTVSYLYPELMKEYDIYDVITPEQVKTALETGQDIGAVFIVSPTYEGRIADIEAIAKVVHEKGIPLIVDEAHGAHLFHTSSCRKGADIVIHSVHKTLPAMTQTALLHVNGSLIDRDRLRRFLHIYQSSSPSYVLMASIDNALQLVEKKGQELFSTFQSNYMEMSEKLSVCQYLQFLKQDAGQDMGKLVISTKKAGLSGQSLYEILLQEYHLQLEMACGSYCLAMFTIGDTEEAFERMSHALLSIEKDIATGKIQTRNTPFVNRQEQAVGNCNAIPLAQAWDMPSEEIGLEEAVGRYVAEFINLYPPGVPLLVPGEVLLENQYRQILNYKVQGYTVQGIGTSHIGSEKGMASNAVPYLVKVLKNSKNTETGRNFYEKD